MMTKTYPVSAGKKVRRRSSKYSYRVRAFMVETGMYRELTPTEGLLYEAIPLSRLPELISDTIFTLSEPSQEQLYAVLAKQRRSRLLRESGYMQAEFRVSEDQILSFTIERQKYIPWLK